MFYLTLFTEVRSWQVPYILIGTPLGIRFAILHITINQLAFVYGITLDKTLRGITKHIAHTRKNKSFDHKDTQHH